jgi:hypothetical protein
MWIASVPTIVFLAAVSVALGAAHDRPACGVQASALHEELGAIESDFRMKSQLHDAAVAMEFFYDSNSQSYAGATLSSLRDLGFCPVVGIDLEILEATKERYRLRATSTGSTAGWEFDSTTAKITSPHP